MTRTVETRNPATAFAMHTLQRSGSYMWYTAVKLAAEHAMAK